MIARSCIATAAALCVVTSAQAQGTAQPAAQWTPDSARTIARACAAVRFPAAGLRERERERRADDAFRRSLAAGDPRSGAACLVARADVRALSGDVGFMVDSVTRFLHVIDSLGERRLATDLRLMRGGSLIAPGLLQLARDDLARSMEDARALGDSVLEFWSATNLAQALYASGDPTAAYRAARRGIVLAQGLSDAEQAVGVALEGDILSGQAKWGQAATKYDSSARLSLRAGYEAGAAHAMELQGSMAMRLREWSKADSVLQDAVHTVVRGGYGGNVAQLNYLLASVSLQRGRRAEARHRLHEASKGAVDDGNLLYFIRARDAEIRWREGDLEGAVRLLHDASDAMDRYRATLTRRDARLTAFEASPDDTDPDAGIASIIAALIVHGRARDALEITERGRARELLSRLSPSPPARDTSSGGTTRLVQQALPRDVALIEYVVGRGGEPTSVFLLTNDSLHGFVTTPVDSLEKPIARLRATLEGNGDASALAATLGTALLHAVVGHLPARVTYLILVPDGALHRVPFDVLRLPDGRLVFERYATSVAPSAAVARALLGGRERAAEGIVAIGGAAYDASVTAEGPALPPLPDAAREVAMVARLGTASTVLRGREANIAAFAAAVRQPRLLLHIATHSRADEYGTGDGALVLSADSANDGMLSATELLDMGIEADLVVLSACRSGVGPLLRGEGMQALTAPFLAGGTRSLLATMWLVGDRSTVPLMTDFYTQLAAGHSVAEALRRARWRAWRGGASPREWAAFVAVGNPTIHIALDAPPSNDRRWIAGVAVALLAAAAWRTYRRRRAKSRQPQS